MANFNFNKLFGAQQQQPTLSDGTTNTITSSSQHCLPDGNWITVTTTSSSTSGDKHIVHSPVSGATIEVNNKTLNSILNGKISIEGITKEEEKELKELEEQRRRWIRREKLKQFQQMPQHLRQEVVDESLIRDCVNGMNCVDSNGFEGTARINELNSKKSHGDLLKSMGNSSGYYTSTTLYTGDVATDTNIRIAESFFKYSFILDQFTTEELLEAHTDATMEESLSED